jgi:hypothetical protein
MDGSPVSMHGEAELRWKLLLDINNGSDEMQPEPTDTPEVLPLVFCHISEYVTCTVELPLIPQEPFFATIQFLMAPLPLR